MPGDQDYSKGMAGYSMEVPISVMRTIDEALNNTWRWSAAWKRAAKFNWRADIGGYLRLAKQLDDARETVETQTATIQHLESDRDALLSQVLYLESVAKDNARLRRRNQVLTDLCTTIETERMNMRAHLVKMLETNLCPECHNPGYHADDCKLRVALGLAK